ncbi:MAG: phospho-sugar mutase [Lachnospiraceae bacterium]|nr:phospho-sugar mutase [Lachnospiraceae bacterium]
MEYREVYESWLNDPAIDEETKEELKSIADNDAEIKDRFFQELEFGTAGLRGVIGAGTNRMNKYTVAKATQGLSDYINQSGSNDPAVAIACDSRRMSPEFVEITAAVLNANGIKAYVFESLRPTPELSFAVRHLNCIAGVNITASHNPAEYNGYKAYWADGAQVTPPHDTGIMECVNKVTNFSSPKMMDKEEAIQKGLYISIGEDVDEAYMAEVAKQVREPEVVKEKAKDVTVVYTPLHGAGIMIVPKLLQRFGFTDFTVVPEQEKPDGNFPTVEFPNPEMPAAFALADKLGQEKNADIIIATDPDADRIGMHVRDKGGNYHELNGNVIGCLICEYELSRRKAQGQLPEDGFVVRSIVSSRLFDIIAESYGVEVKKVLTGFKNIGAEILKSEESGKGTYLFGYEESYGYLVGTYARDKDACVAALKLCEMCTYYKSEGKTLWDAVEEMYQKYGFHLEKTISVTKKGIDGMAAIAKTMEDMRNDPPKELGGFEILSFLDYQKPETTGLSKSNVLYFDLPDAWVCVRPSGTEPKIKYYVGVKAENEDQAKDMVAALEQGIMQKE